MILLRECCVAPPRALGPLACVHWVGHGTCRLDAMGGARVQTGVLHRDGRRAAPTERRETRTVDQGRVPSVLGATGTARQKLLPVPACRSI
jgi:hypothetical protein